jgi:hypothetical protein
MLLYAFITVAVLPVSGVTVEPGRASNVSITLCTCTGVLDVKLQTFKLVSVVSFMTLQLCPTVPIR